MSQTDATVIPYGYVYKVTYPNGKIYVGRDTAMNAECDYFKYFGSPSDKAKRLLKDEIGPLLTAEKRLVVTKELLYEARNCTVGHIKEMERKYILLTGSRNRDIGYNF